MGTIMDDDTEAEEQARECKRNGHRDTGRGECAYCGEFLDYESD
jgi:hypothetical protein